MSFCLHRFPQSKIFKYKYLHYIIDPSMIKSYFHFAYRFILSVKASKYFGLNLQCGNVSSQLSPPLPAVKPSIHAVPEISSRAHSELSVNKVANTYR